MIKISLILIIMATLNIVIAAPSQPFLQIITEKDKSEVLAIIDRVCADSWCSGDYEYKFSTFSCNDNTAACTLTFKIIDRDAKPGEVNFRNKRCIFKEITSKEKIFTGVTLNEEFYDQLNYCVSNRESK
ncbi:MAG: hypothetical protein H7281_04945 [Bacteriovorax sp.]|nr:hypothetical protein [Bacteriovorax sp.]